MYDTYYGKGKDRVSAHASESEENQLRYDNTRARQTARCLRVLSAAYIASCSCVRLMLLQREKLYQKAGQEADMAKEAMREGYRRGKLFL
jgi:hypothetical protein